MYEGTNEGLVVGAEVLGATEGRNVVGKQVGS
jgi:hypothetical protein